MPDPKPIATKEIHFSRQLLPQLLKTFKGFEQSHLESILGKTSLESLTYKSDGYSAITGMIDFDLYSGTKAVALIRSYMGFDGRPPFSFFDIDAYSSTDSQNRRGIRLAWANHRFETPKGETIEDLFLENMQLLPNEGETYEPFTINVKNRKIQGKREFMPQINSPFSIGSSENMHYVKFIMDHGEVKAVSTRGTEYPIDVQLNHGVYEIRGYAEGVIFKHPFMFTLPAQIKVDNRNFNQVVQLFIQ